MSQVHACARTTPVVRAEIRACGLSVAEAALKYNITRTTAAKWMRREDPQDRSHRPHKLSTTLTPGQEAIVAEVRRLGLVALDDLLVVVREFINPAVSRSGLDRCLRRHGVANLRELQALAHAEAGPTAARKPKGFKDYEPGFVHVDIKYLPQMPDEASRSYLFVAIDRATRWVFLRVYPDQSEASALDFLNRLHEAAPMRISHVLSDNGCQFTDRFSSKQRQPSGRHHFDVRCRALGIEHRLCPPRHPQTNGMVERFNGRISELVRQTRFHSAAELHHTLSAYCQTYNHHIPQRALGHLTPIQKLKSWRSEKPHLFRKSVYEQAGLDSLKREGLTTTLRLELRELLAPKVVLKKPFRWSDDDASSTDEPTRIKQLVDWELALAVDHVHSILRDLAGEPWRSALPHLLEDFQQLLRDALDLLRELGEADERTDRSHLDLPSITPHWQNRGFSDWVSLIEFLRDAWLAIRVNDRARATRIAQNWFELPYPTFKRLALFAASHDDCIQPKQWVDWLLTDDAWWLWSTDTGREVFRLLLLQGQSLAGVTQQSLEGAILAGPPREMYRDDLEAERWQDLVAHSVWLHLAKLNTSGLILGTSAAARLAELSTAYPQLQLATNERDEFSHWITGTGDPDYEDSRNVDIAPRKREELVQWLTKPVPERQPFYEDTWREVCRSRFFHSLCALCDLAQDGVWPAGRWREALQAWAEEGMVLRSWRYAAPLVQTMPDAVLMEVDHAVTWWMEAASKAISRHKDILLNLCHRVLALPLETGSRSRIIRNGVETYDPVGSAINHPIGHATHALINLWFKGTSAQPPPERELMHGSPHDETSTEFAADFARIWPFSA